MDDPTAVKTSTCSAAPTADRFHGDDGGSAAHVKGVAAAEAAVKGSPPGSGSRGNTRDIRSNKELGQLSRDPGLSIRGR